MKSILSSLLIFGSCLAYGQLYINEHSCSNSNGPTDFEGDRPDWAELYNAGATAVNLTGYYLSDRETNLTKFEIPAGASVPAGGFTKVFFSRKGVVAAGEVHASFALRQCADEWIILTDPFGDVVDSLKLIKSRRTQKNHSYARTTDGAGTWGICTTPTLGATNTGVLNYYAPTPVLSVEAGFYPGPQNVTITCSDLGAEIRYTTDGTVPTGASTLYVGPVNIAATSVLRAIAINPSPMIPNSFVETNSYFIGVTHTMPVISICGNQITAFINDVAPGSFTNNFDGHFEFFETEGMFCSFPCIKAYIMENLNNPRYKESLSNLTLLFSNIHKCVKPIPIAPSWKVLEDWCGHQTIEQYRSSFDRLVYEDTNNVMRPIMFPVSTIYEEIKV